MFRFLHAADLHIDSPLLGLECTEGAPAQEARRATRQAFENLVSLALNERASFVVLAGDLYDGTWRDYGTGLFFIRQMHRLRDEQIPVFLVYGNHDAQNHMTRILALPDNVRVFGSSHPETHHLEAHGVAIHGQSYATRAITADLAASYPSGVPGLFNIGLLHTCAQGYEGHDRYAPTSLDILRSKQYQYWALGHVHRREILATDPYIVFPGNIQGRHIRETGPKGCSIVTVEDTHAVSIAHRNLDVVRWERIHYEAAPGDTASDIYERIQQDLGGLTVRLENHLCAVRVEVSGACQAHREFVNDPENAIHQIRSLGLAWADRIWIEKVRLGTRNQRAPEDRAAGMDVMGGLLARFKRLEQEDEALQELADLFTELRPKLPPELREGPEPMDLKSPDLLRRAAQDARELLLQRLQGGDL